MCPDPDTRDLISPQQIGVTEGQQVVGVSLVRVRDPDRISISETEPPRRKGHHRLRLPPPLLFLLFLFLPLVSVDRLLPLPGSRPPNYAVCLAVGSASLFFLDHTTAYFLILFLLLFFLLLLFSTLSFFFSLPPHSVILSSRFILWLRGRRHLISVPASVPVIAPGTG